MTPLARIGFVAALLFGATAVRFVVRFELGTEFPLTTYIGAALIGAWWGGWRLGAVVTALGVALAFVLFSDLAYPPVASMAMGVALSGLGIWLIDSLQTAQADKSQATERFVRLTESMTDYFMVLDSELKILEANSALARAVGEEPSSLIGVRLADRWPQTEEMTTKYRTALRTSEPLHEVIKGEITGRYFEIHAYPSEETLFVFFRDITESHEAALKLEAMRETYRLATDAVQGLVYDWSLENNHVSWSSGLEALIGVRPSETSHDQAWWQARIHPDDRMAVIATTTTAPN